LIPSSARDDGSIDANDLADHIHQRATGISRVNGRIRLNESLELLADIAAVSLPCRKPNGLPIARAQSPTCTASEFPSLATGKSRPASILMTAKSVSS